jgi:hypothetical protein
LGDSAGRLDGRRGRNRTCNRRIRNPMLYPFELRALAKLEPFYCILLMELFAWERLVWL